MSLDFAKHDRWLRSFSSKVLRRIRAAGVRAVEFEDIYQETTVGWCLARDGFDPSRGVPFEPFMFNGVKNHINRWVEKQIGFALMTPVSLDNADMTEGDSEIHEVIPDKTESIENVIARESNWRFVLGRVSERAQMFLKLLRDPPQQLVDAHAKILVRASYGRERGITTFCPKEITERLIFDLMEVGVTERKRIKEEIAAAITKMEKISEKVTKPEILGAPGCYGSALTYSENHIECKSCEFASSCSVLSLDRRNKLRESLGIKIKSEKKKTPQAVVSAPRPALTMTTPKSVLDIVERINKSKIRVGELLRSGVNPFPSDPKFLAVACLMLIKLGTVTRPLIAKGIERKLGVSEKMASSLALAAIMTLKEIGVIDESNGNYTIRR
jgi:DNA-directed RNA polymerase specialized sigma24 family protein